MIKQTIISFLIILYNKYILRIPDDRLYSYIINFSSSNGLNLFAAATAISVALVVLAYVFMDGELYKAIYTISKLTMHASRLLITFLCISNVIFWLNLEQNLFQDISYLSCMIPFELLVATCLAVRQVDFNFQFQNTLVETIALSIISLVFVNAIGPAYIL